MKHAVYYCGPYEENSHLLRAGATSTVPSAYRKKGGRTGVVVRPEVTGIAFGYMQDGDAVIPPGSRGVFIAVSAGDILLNVPVQVKDGGVHLGFGPDGKAKWFGPKATEIDDAPARQLLLDMAEKNPLKRTALLALWEKASAASSDEGSSAQRVRTSSEIPAHVPSGTVADHLARAYHAALLSVNVLAADRDFKAEHNVQALPQRSMFPLTFFDKEVPGYRISARRRAERSNRKAFAELIATKLPHSAPKENWSGGRGIYDQARELLRVTADLAAAEGLDPYAHRPLHAPAPCEPDRMSAQSNTVGPSLASPIENPPDGTPATAQPSGEMSASDVTHDEPRVNDVETPAAEHPAADPVQEFVDRFVSMPETTEVERIVKQRVGQEFFRARLLEYWGGRCAITGLAVPRLLRASHIKGWAECETHAERLDPCNGLLLAPHLDAAFDAHLISVDDDGRVIVSDDLSDEARGVLGLDAPLMVGNLTERHRAYLAWHRARASER